jgi:hypothetical protein
LIDETIFFEELDVKITNARLKIGSQTFSLNNITSVDIGEEKQGCLPAFGGLLLISGVVNLFSSGEDKGIAIFMIVIGAGMLSIPKQYHVILRTAGNEVKVLQNPDKTYIEKIIDAINNAMKHSVNNVFDEVKKETKFKEDFVSEKNKDEKVTTHSIIDELKKLAELRDAGILSDSEFQQLKEKLLAKG